MLQSLILIVDDEKPFVETMTKRLNKRGLTTVAAYSGFEALEQLSHTNEIDAIILDVKMPGMDGIETLRQIKKKYPLIEVLMLTGHATVETAIEGMKLGAYDYLMKPCDIEVLINKVNEAVQKKKRHEEKINDALVKKAIAKP